MYDDFKVANYSKALLSPELYARHLSRLFTGDVIDGLTVTPGTGLQVVLAPGNALIRYGSANVASAREVSLVANFNLTIGTADVSNPRIDLVVVYVDNGVTLPSGTPTAANLDGKGVAKAKIVQGTAAASPSAPNSTAIQSSVGSGNPYTVVAEVRVDAGVSVIAANKITDVRSLVTQTFKTKAGGIDFSTLPFEGAGGSSSTNSATSYGNLSTPVSVTIDVPSTGNVAVVMSARLFNTTTSDQTGYVSFAASGANTIAAADANAIAYKILGGNADASYARVKSLTGLTPGSTTFTLQRRTTGGSLQVINADLIVIPMS